MKYEKIIKDKYNLHLIETNRFKTICINISFSEKFNKKDIPYLSLLTKILIASTKKYKSSTELAIQGENLYGSVIFSSFNILGNIERMMVSIEFLNPKYTENSEVKKNLDFLKECIFNPNIKNNTFENKIFNNIKNSLIKNIESLKDNPYSFSLMEFKKEMYQDIGLGYNLYNNVDSIEKISAKDLYAFYLKLINNFKIDIFITGDLEYKNDYIEMIANLFKSVDKRKIKELSFDCNYKNVSKKEIIKSGNYNQSQLFIGYTFKDLTDYEKKYVIFFYNSILGGINNSILFTEVREKNSLCYTVGSNITRNPASIIISTEIDKNNYKKALTLIDKSFKSMSNSNKIKSLFENAKENINTSLNMYYDDKTFMVEHFYKKEFCIVDDIETQRKAYMDIKVEDILNINKKISRSVIYFLEGDME